MLLGKVFEFIGKIRKPREKNVTILLLLENKFCFAFCSLLYILILKNNKNCLNN